jgi:hypothetical protein
MKKLAVLGVIFLSFNSFGQDLIVENIDQNKVLYRGFENKLIIGKIDGNGEVFQMEAFNCEVSKLDGNANTYIVKTKSKARTAKINFISDGQITDSAKFIVRNLPAPSLFWGNQEAGSNVSNSSEMKIKYPFGITLKSSFEIVSWKCHSKDTKYEGVGNLLSQEFLDFTKSIKTGEFITIVVNVKGEDGVIRRLTGSWVKE